MQKKKTPLPSQIHTDTNWRSGAVGGGGWGGGSSTLMTNEQLQGIGELRGRLVDQ